MSRMYCPISIVYPLHKMDKTYWTFFVVSDASTAFSDSGLESVEGECNAGSDKSDEGLIYAWF